jgi:hypothetical protein
MLGVNAITANREVVHAQGKDALRVVWPSGGHGRLPRRLRRQSANTFGPMLRQPLAQDIGHASL